MELAELETRLLSKRPFAQDRIAEPSDIQDDVASIHGAQYARIIEIAGQVREDRRSQGVLLSASPGIGKSHLLGRLAGWAQDEAAYFLFHGIRVPASMLARYVLNSVMHRLSSERSEGYTSREKRSVPLHETVLYDLVRKAVASAVAQLRSNGEKVDRKIAQEKYNEFCDVLLQRHPPSGQPYGRIIYKVLFKFFLSVHDAHHHRKSDPELITYARLAVRWLRGEALEEDEYKTLSVKNMLGQFSEDGAGDEYLVEQMLVALGELLAIDGKVLLLCFDQVELMSDDLLSALFDFGHTLIDHSSNLLMITCGVRENLQLHAKEFVRQAAYDRVAGNDLQLDEIGAEQSRELLARRLEKVRQETLACDAAPTSAKEDPLFPLGAAWHRETFGVDARPRKVIQLARRRWDDQMQRLRNEGIAAWLADWEHSLAADLPFDERPWEALVDEKVEAKFQEHVRRRELDPNLIPPNASQTLGLVEGLLRQTLSVPESGYTLRSLERFEPTATPKPTYHLVAEEQGPDGQTVRSGMVFLDSENKQIAYYALQRACQDENPPEHVYLVTDERRELSLGAGGQERLEQLKSRGPDRFQHRPLTVSELAELEALAAVANEAQSGDLEIVRGDGSTQPVSVAEVIAAHHRGQRYLHHALLRELLTEQPLARCEPEALPANGDSEELREIIRGELALTCGTDTGELAAVAVRKLGGESVPMQRKIEQVALQMHRSGELNASPVDDHYFLLPRTPR